MSKFQFELKGQLSQTPFPRLLWNLYVAGAQGNLLLSRGDLRKTIVFEEGQPIHADSNLLHETLGRFLVSEKLISDEQDQKANEQALVGQKAFGDVLLSMGALEPAALYEGIRKNLAVKILDCFSWETGDYLFEEGSKGTIDQNLSLKMNPARLILKGVRAYFPLTRIEAESRFSSEKAFRVARKGQDRGRDAFQLTAEEIGFLTRFRSPRRVEEVMNEADLPREAVIRLLYAMTTLGLLEPTSDSDEISLDELVSASLLQSLKPTEPEVSVAEADDETRELANTIAEDHMRLMSLNYFELFDLPEDATAVTIRDRFVEFSAKYNPGRFRKGDLGAFQNLGEEIFLRGVKAFSSLSDFESKTKYLDRLKADRKKAGEEKKKPGEAFKIQTALLDGDSQFKKGLQFLKTKKFDKAIEFFEYAKDIDACNPSYLAHLGWALFQKNPERNVKDVEEMLRKARELEANSDAAYYLGKFLQSRDKSDEALEHLRVAVDLDPKNIDKVRELRNAERGKK